MRRRDEVIMSPRATCYHNRKCRSFKVAVLGLFQVLPDVIVSNTPHAVVVYYYHNGWSQDYKIILHLMDQKYDSVIIYHIGVLSPWYISDGDNQTSLNQIGSHVASNICMYHSVLNKIHVEDQ